MPIFIGLALMYEHAKIPYYILFLFDFCLVLFCVGFHRYFILEDKELKIVSFNPFLPSKILISDIDKIEITRLSLTIFVKQSSKGKIFYMRKWPKKYFLDALAVHPEFQGEVILVDNFVNLDYFEHYKADKQSKI